MKVHIDAGGRTVTAECSDTNMTIGHLLAETLVTWRATAGATPPSDGPATYGYINNAAADTDPTSTMRHPMGATR